MADFGKAFGEAFRYAWSPRKVLPFFVIGLIILVTLLFTAKAVITVYPTFQSHGQIASSFYFIQIILIDAFVFLIVGFACVYFKGAIIDNSRHFYSGKNKELNYNNASAKYLSVLGAVVLAAIIAALAGMIPILGIALMIIVSWLFFYVMQAVMISDETATGSLKKSYAVFMENKLNTILFWILLAIISFAIFLVALIPLMMGALPAIAALAKGASITTIMIAIENNLYALFAGGVVTVAILSYLIVFETSAKTFFYMQLVKQKRKRK